MTSILFKDITALTETGECVQHAFVGVQNGIITHVQTEMPTDRFDRVYDGRGKLVMPALYNAHSHVPMTLLRGRGENLSLDRWLNDSIFPFEDHMTSDMVYYGMLLGVAESLRFGVASCSDMYFWNDARAKAVLESGIKCNLSDCIVVFDPKQSYYDLKLCAENARLMKEYHGAGDGRLLIEFSVHAEYTTTPRSVETIAEAARDAGVRMHIHVSETQKEVQDCLARHGKTPPVYLADLGLFDVPTTAAHCVWLTDEDRAVLKEKGVHVATCPASNAKLGSGIADVASLLKDGVPVALGTDGVASNNNHNMFKELYLLALLQRAADADPVGVSSEEIITIATRNGALSQGREDCGMLKVGSKADLAVLDIDTPWMNPVQTMAGNLVYSAQGSDVVMTMVDGKILYENGEYLTIDVERAIAETNAARVAVDQALARGEKGGREK